MVASVSSGCPVAACWWLNCPVPSATYTVYRSTEAGHALSHPLISFPMATCYVDTGAMPGLTYFYQICTTTGVCSQELTATVTGISATLVLESAGH